MIEWVHLLDLFVLQLMEVGSNRIGIIIAKIISLLGNPFTWFIVATYYYWKGNRKRAFHVMLLIMFASIISSAIKNFFKRPRPSIKPVLFLPEPLAKASEYYSTYSFPSGHSVIIGSFYSFFRRYLSKHHRILLFLALVAVGLARLYLGVHYLSDVIFGLALGFVLGEIVFHAEKRFGYKLHSLKYPHGKLGLLLIAIAFLTALLLQLSILAFPSLGFFLGHFYSMHRKKHKEEFYWPKEFIGFSGLALIGLIALYSPTPLQETLFFLFGLWVTLLYPCLYNRFLKKDNTN